MKNEKDFLLYFVAIYQIFIFAIISIIFKIFQISAYYPKLISSTNNMQRMLFPTVNVEPNTTIQVNGEEVAVNKCVWIAN